MTTLKERIENDDETPCRIIARIANDKNSSRWRTFTDIMPGEAAQIYFDGIKRDFEPSAQIGIETCYVFVDKKTNEKIEHGHESFIFETTVGKL